MAQGSQRGGRERSLRRQQMRRCRQQWLLLQRLQSQTSWQPRLRQPQPAAIRTFGIRDCLPTVMLLITSHLLSGLPQVAGQRKGSPSVCHNHMTTLQAATEK